MPFFLLPSPALLWLCLGHKAGAITKHELVHFMADFIHALAKGPDLHLAVRFAIFTLELLAHFKKGTLPHPLYTTSV